MKNENVAKINKLGKVSRIIIAIMRIAFIIGLVGCIIGTAVTAFVPNSKLNEFWARGSATATIETSGNPNYFISTSSGMKIGGVSVMSIDDLELLDGKNFDLWGMNINMNVDKTENANGDSYDIKADFGAENAKGMFNAAMLVSVLCGIVCAVGTAISCFALKLAKSLETCESPFQENVVTAMKKFAYSLIPLAVIYLIAGGINATAVLIILALIIFTYIFSYGAELQKESDETI